MVLLLGCAGSSPVPDISDRAASAAGIADAIRFTAIGEPIDVANSGPETLTLRDAVERTLRHSPEVQAALARAMSARADADQARLLPNPILSVILRFPEDGGPLDVEAGLTADLVSLLSRRGRVGAADNHLRAAATAALTQVLDVLAEVRQRYVGVQTLDAAVGVLQDRLRLVDRLVSLAESRVAGPGTRLDVITLQTQQVDLQSVIAERELELRQERLALARLIGEPSGPADWRLAPWHVDREISMSESEWVDLALKNRPEVQAQRFELAALGAELRLVRWAAWDGADAGVDAERGNGNWSVGPSVSTPLPLFDFGQARRRRAQAAMIEGRHNFTQIQRQVVEGTRQAYSAYSVSLANLERVRDRLVPLSEQRRNQAEAQFKAGKIDVTGLLLAEQELRAARIRLLELQRARTEALIKLERAVGGPGVVEHAPTTIPATAPTTTQQAR